MLLYPYNILLLGPPPSRHTSVFFVLRSKSTVFSEKVINTCVFYHAAQSGTFFLEKLETSINLCVFDICTFCTSLLTSDWLLGLLVPLWGRSRSLLALLAPCWASFLAFLGALLTPLGRLLAPLGRLLGFSWLLLGLSWLLLGGCWLLLGASWASLGRS